MTIRVIKLALKVIASGSENKQRLWKRLYQIFNDSYKAGNWIATGQYMNDQLMRKLISNVKNAERRSMPIIMLQRISHVL
jgi:RNA polymerase-interacting CarD/CdnL/TRCF family regulator